MGARPTEVATLLATVLASVVAGCHSKGFAVPGIGGIRAAYKAPPGSPLTCLGVVDVATGKTWGPDGKPGSVAGSSMASAVGAKKLAPGEVYKTIIFAAPTGPKGTMPRYELDVRGELSSTMFGGKPTIGFTSALSTDYDVATSRWLFGVTTNFKTTDAQADVAVRDLNAPWKPIALCTLRRGAIAYVKVLGPPDLKPRISSSAPGWLCLLIDLPAGQNPNGIQAVAYSTDGRKLRNASWGGLKGSTATLNVPVPPSRIARLEIQWRPIRTTKFENVNLQAR